MTVASLALGQQCYGVTLRELTAGYTACATGCYRAPVSYHRVLDSHGNVLLSNPRVQAEEGRVLSEETAAIMTKMLEGSKNLTFTDTTVKIMSALSDESRAQIEALAAEL